MESRSSVVLGKVSIIVPIYNCQHELPRCIESLLGQTYTPFEIILVNDGSTDASLSICHSYERKYNNILIVDKANGGASSARNAGMDVASGEYIMFCDSDDWVEPDYCETFIKHFEKDSLVFSDPSSASLKRDGIYRIDKKEALLLRGEGIESPVSKLFEASVIRDNALRFPEQLALGEDYVFVLRYLSCISGDLLRLEYSLYHYEERMKEGLSKQIPTCEQTEFFYEQLFEIMKKIDICDSESSFIRDRSCMLDFEKRICSDGKEKGSSFVKRYRRIRRTMTCDTYKATSYAGVGSQNRLYELLFRKRKPFLLACYYSFHM